ncbi:hypothetical protein T09_15203 [Trichinella sp. T9]|nr:hypothetical protein T09_15203 [Trichinella sp. T9]
MEAALAGLHPSRLARWQIDNSRSFPISKSTIHEQNRSVSRFGADNKPHTATDCHLMVFVCPLTFMKMKKIKFFKSTDMFPGLTIAFGRFLSSREIEIVITI